MDIFNQRFEIGMRQYQIGMTKLRKTISTPQMNLPTVLHTKLELTVFMAGSKSFFTWRVKFGLLHNDHANEPLDVLTTKAVKPFTLFLPLFCTTFCFLILFRFRVESSQFFPVRNVPQTGFFRIFRWRFWPLPCSCALQRFVQQKRAER